MKLFNRINKVNQANKLIKERKTTFNENMKTKMSEELAKHKKDREEKRKNYSPQVKEILMEANSSEKAEKHKLGITNDTKIILFFDNQMDADRAKANGLVKSLCESSNVTENQINYQIGKDNKTVGKIMNIILSDPSINTMVDFTETQAIKTAARDEDIINREFDKHPSGTPPLISFYEHKNIVEYDKMNEIYALSKALVINPIAQNIAIDLFGTDYTKNSGRVKDKEIINGILTEALKDTDLSTLKKHKAIISEKLAPKIKELTEPTFLGKTLKYMNQNSDRIQIKSTTKEDRAKITTELKELFKNEVKKIEEEKKRMSIPTLSPNSTPAPKKSTIMKFFGRS